MVTNVFEVLVSGLVAALVAGLAAAVTVLALKGKYGMIAIGLLVRVCWVVGAIRLAKPGSVWARTFYDREQLDECVRRFPDAAGAAGAVPAPQRPPAPRAVRIGAACAALCLLSGLTGLAGGLLAGPALAMLPFAVAGLRWARTTVLVLAGVLTVLVTLMTAGAHPVTLVVAGAVRLALLGAAVQLLVRDPAARRYSASRELPA